LATTYTTARHRDEARPREAQRLDGTDVPGVGQGHGGAGLDEGAGHEVEGLLRPVGDDHLVDGNAVALGRPLAQWEEPLGRGVLQGRRLGGEDGRECIGQSRGRKGLGRREPAGE
jgi:hypothetical protein